MEEYGYIAGWDGGGTKTACEIRRIKKEKGGSFLLEEDGFRLKAGALNVGTASKAGIMQTVRELLNAMRSMKGGLFDCRMLCIGTAGASNPVVVERIKEALLKEGYSGKFLLTGDDETALRGALSGRPGAVLIAGTGSICVGIDSYGKKHRAGGYGHILDDEGSGYAIGRDILCAVIREKDGRGEATALSSEVYKRLKTERIEEIVAFVHAEKTGKKEIASFADLLPVGLDRNDAVSLRICEKAAEELSVMVKAVMRKMDEKARELAFCGSVLNHCLPLRKRVEENLKSEGILFSPVEHDAAYGACLMAANALTRGGE